MRRLTPVLLSVVIVGAMAGYAISQSDLLGALAGVSPAQIGLLLALGLGGLLAQAQQFRAALRVSDTEIGAFEATGLTAINTMANYYVPARGGTVVRAAYMHSVHAMSVSAYAMLTIVTVVVGLIVAIVAGLTAAVLLTVTGSGVGAGMLAPFLGVLALMGAALGVAVVSARVLARSNRLSSAIARLSSAAKLWRNVPMAGLRLLAWTAVVLLMQAARLFVAFAAVGASVSVLEMVLIGSLVSMSFVISITPGNLGIKEGVTALAGALVGVEPNVALVGSLIDRGAALAVTFGAGIVSLGPLAARATAAGRKRSEP